MNEKSSAGGFIGYEYKTITIPRDLEPLYADGYANFGWMPEGADSTPSMTGADTVTLKLKRDRSIRNKAELTRLQLQFEACANDLRTMERSKTTNASITAFSIGLVGTAFMAGSVFAYLGGFLLPSTVLAVPGFLGWIIPYFAYRKVKQARTEKLTPFIEQKYDEIYDTCEKAHGLLAE